MSGAEERRATRGRRASRCGRRPRIGAWTAGLLLASAAGHAAAAAGVGAAAAAGVGAAAGAAAHAGLGEAVVAEAAVREAIAELPADTGRVIVVPRLARLAARLDESLAGMNRAGLLLGADPVDQLLGLLGFSRHVDRHAAVVAGFVPDPAGGDAPAVVVLVPSRDPAAFLETNFRPGPEPGTVRDAAGRTLRVAARGRHVAMVAARHAGVLAGGGMGTDAADAWLADLPAPMRSMLVEDDVVLLSRTLGPAAGGPPPLLAAAARGLDAGLLTGPAAAVARTLLGRLEAALDPAGPLAAAAGPVAASLRFDPLGLIGRARVAWDEPVSEAATPAAGAGAPDGSAAGEVDPLASVPPGPMLLAGGWVRPPGAGTASIDRLLAGLGLDVAPRWRGVRGLALHVPRHSGGFATGLLAGGSLLARGRAAVAAAGEAGPWAAVPGWTLEVASPTPPDGAGRGRWTVRRAGGGGTPGAAMLAVLAGGPRGLAGPLEPVAGRSMVAAQVPEGAGARAGDEDDRRGGALEPPASADASYAADFAVALMRDLRPWTATAEAYVDVAAISRWAAGAAADAPMLGPVAPIDGELPPVGLGAAGDAEGVDLHLLVPAPLAAIAFDAAAGAGLAALAELAGAPAAADDDAAADGAGAADGTGAAAGSGRGPGGADRR